MRHNIRIAPYVCWCCAIFATCALAQDSTDDHGDLWLPTRCVPLETIGFHDEAEVEGDPVEDFGPAKFKSTPFTLRENKTLSGLLDDDDDVNLFLTMQMAETNELFEFSCKTVLGANREPGYSCVNTPPSDILMLNPKSLRFSRAAIGSWTFQSESNLLTGSSLFVEMGQCYSLDSDSDSN